MVSDLLTAGEVAVLTGLSHRTVTRLCESGEIKAAKLGKSWRINRAALAEKLQVDEEVLTR